MTDCLQRNPQKTTPEQNKALVLQAFDTLFNNLDYEGAARFWSDTYIQHSAHIEPGRDGLFNLTRSTPATLRYEHHLIVAQGVQNGTRHAWAKQNHKAHDHVVLSKRGERVTLCR